MELKKILDDIDIPEDREGFSDSAIALAQEFINGSNKFEELESFLSKHVQLEERNIAVFEEFSRIVYHDNVALAAKIRCKAYEIMLNRLRLEG